MSLPRPQVLCLDIEGGHGGSSRSLYESIYHLDRNAVDVEVWCGRPGNIQRKYTEIGVRSHVTPEMPRFSSLPHLSRNLYTLACALGKYRRTHALRIRLLREIGDRFDLVHFNHEALFPLGRWLRRRSRTPQTMHIRTNLHDSVFARWQTRSIAASIDHLIFITENEHRSFVALGGRPRNATVIHNIVTSRDNIAPHERIAQDARFKIACLSNYSWFRGLDRLLDIADELSRLGLRDVLFVMAGDMQLTRSLPGDLGRQGRRGGTLADYVDERGLSDMFLFLGHVDEPERVLTACDVLIKPTREGNPWGRDILEGLAVGIPVVSFGTYDMFVEHDATGILRKDFDAAQIARDILGLADDPEKLRKMGEMGRARVAELCDGPARAADLLTVWRATMDLT